MFYNWNQGVTTPKEDPAISEFQNFSGGSKRRQDRWQPKESGSKKSGLQRSHMFRSGNQESMVDLFISNKKSRLGKRFVFIRFADVNDPDRMIRDLCGIWFGYHKLFAAVPGFSKNSKPHAPHATEGNSRVKEQNGDFIVEKRHRACFIRGRDFLTLPNLRMLCYDEGFEDFDICYFGGLWVMLEFKHEVA
ncbi:unnamed protein product [Lactuca saligna]|uniref:RRM domain-containing protein n=1 Tax=Lactuca saligna TaxID=75948 RepID=A0AA35ZZI4_LACSI|nr:unnamed protein product [Lactuca saligna]